MFFPDFISILENYFLKFGQFLKSPPDSGDGDCDRHSGPSQRRMTCVEALWWPFIKRVNRDNTKFRDKIAYVGGPSFRRRP